MILRWGVLALAVLGITGCSRSSSPTVVLISVDTLRADHLPAYGYRGVATPAIDSLARDAVRFENAYSHVPLTLPSHAVLLTGLLPYENGVRDNLGYRLAESRSTVATRLRARGYATGAAVSSYVLRANRGLASGFDVYDDAMPDNSTRERAGMESVAALIRFAETVHDKPIFLFLHLYEPHFPYAPPEPFRGRYSKNPYDGEIATADAAVGRLLDFLRRKNLYDGALILFVSDHGEGLGDHGEDEHGVFLYRETLRVPLLCKYPGSQGRGRVESVPVGLSDVVPTVLAAVGAPAAGELTGVALSRAASQKPRLIYAESLYPKLNFGWSDLASLTDDRYEYIEAPRPELYDIRSDPAERRDLAAGLPAPFRSMRAALAKIPRPESKPEASTPEELKKLAALGYVHVSAPPATGALPDPKDRVESLRDFRRLLALYYEGKDVEAIALGRRMAEAEPGVLSIWTALAGSLERLGRPAEAAAALKEGLALSTAGAAVEQRMQAYDDLSRLLAASGDRRAGEAALRDAVASGAASEGARRDLAKIYLESGRAGQAVELLRASASAEPASLEMLGIALASVGNEAEAKTTLLRAWEAAPGSARVALNLGVLALRRSEATEAQEWLGRAVQAGPDNAAAWADLGLAQAAAGDAGAAAKSWERAIALNPDQCEAVFNLALFEMKTGALDTGRKRMAHFLAVAPPQRYGRELAEARRLLAFRNKA